MKLIPSDGCLERSSVSAEEFLCISFDVKVQDSPKGVSDPESTVVLDCIVINEFSGIAALVGSECEFPINPEEGYIDGSIYLNHCHNPFDVTKIQFRSYDGSYLSCKIYGIIDLEYERVVNNNGRFQVALDLRLRVSEELPN